MEYHHIQLTQDQGITTISLNRPDTLNAFNFSMMAEMADALNKANADSAVRVAIITGAGRVFSSGADLRERFLEPIEKSRRGELNLAFEPSLADTGVPAFQGFKKPLIAAINGAAIGLGCTISLNCDIRIGSEKARIGFGFVRVGLIPEFGSTYLLPRIIGLGKALELLYTGRVVDAPEALALGLLNRVVPHEELLKNARDLARTIVDNPPVSVRLTKEGIYRGISSDMGTALRWEQFALNQARHTEDHEEAVRAILEKRKPSFKGR